jgi:hypothetical protein
MERSGTSGLSVEASGGKNPSTVATEMPSAALKVFSLVTFFGPAKKVTRLPAGTGEFV